MRSPLIDWTNTIEGIILKFKVFLLLLVMKFWRIKFWVYKYPACKKWHRRLLQIGQIKPQKYNWAHGAQKGLLNWDVPWMNVKFLLRTKLNYQIFILILSFEKEKNRLESRDFILANFVSVFILVFMLPLCSSCGDHLVGLFWRSTDWLLHGMWEQMEPRGFRWDVGSE